MNHWTIARARQNFSGLLEACHLGIQPIYRRNRLIAAVIDAATYQQMQKSIQSKPTLADSFAELRAILQEEDALPMLPRYNRTNDFAEMLGE